MLTGPLLAYREKLVSGMSIAGDSTGDAGAGPAMLGAQDVSWPDRSMGYGSRGKMSMLKALESLYDVEPRQEKATAC